jgi:malate permease and related proteins
MPQSVFQSLVLILLIASGYGAGKLKIFSAITVRELSKFIVDFSLPAIIIISMQKPFSPELRDESFRMIGISFAVYAVALPLSVLWARALRSQGNERGIHEFAASFSNVAFMGFPIMNALFGKDSLFAVSIYNIPFQLLAFSVGILMITRGKNGSARFTLRSFLSPAILAALIGFAFFLCSFRIPEPLFSGVSALGDLTTPLSMIVIGVILSRMSLKGAFGNPRVYLTTLYRLILFPLLAWVILSALGLKGNSLAVPVIIAAMPVAANATILADAYEGDAQTASSLVFISTIVSMATIPLMAWVLFKV